MRLVVFTRPEFFGGEAGEIAELLEVGVDVVHLRKPGADLRQCAGLLAGVPEAWHGSIVVHDHFELLHDFALKGVCLNSRRGDVPQGISPGAVCCGCHSLDELRQRKAVRDAGAGKPFDYLFLSPIFDSISKQGYGAAFDSRHLCEAAACGLIDSRVVALGGVTADKCRQIAQWNFGGMAMLGAVWGKPRSERIEMIKKLKG